MHQLQNWVKIWITNSYTCGCCNRKKKAPTVLVEHVIVHDCVVLGGRGHSGVWHGHRQAWRQVCHPPHHQQVHRELLPREWTCRWTLFPFYQDRKLLSTTLLFLSVCIIKTHTVFESPGRDDSPADCIVYFGFPDIFRISTMVVMENVGQQKLRQMVHYCQNIDR